MQQDKTDSSNRVLELSVSITGSTPKVRPGIERRRDPRMPLGLWAHCQIDGVVSQRALGDLSVSGLYLRMNVAPRMGARIRIVLGLPYISGQRVCSLSGRIVWVHVEGSIVHGAGVQFDHETDSADHDLLKGFLALWGVPAKRPLVRPRH